MGKNLDNAIADINKKFGAMSATTVNSMERLDLEVIDSGSMSINIALGVGGYPKGRIVEIFGWESSGKTTLTLHAIAEAQKNGGKAAFIDAEHAFDPTYAEALGVDLDELIIAQPDNGEQALEIAEMLIKSGDLSICVVDSVAALVPRAEIDGDMGDSNMGVHARLMSQAMRKLSPIVSKSSTCLIFINQLREKIGVMFGNPQTTTGGNALKFYASVRIEVSKVSQPLKDKEGTATGSRTKAKVVKNKVAPPFKVAEFDIVYGVGIDRVSEIFDLAVTHGVITKSGSHYSYGDSKLGQGKETATALLKDNEELVEEIETILIKGISK